MAYTGFLNRTNATRLFANFETTPYIHSIGMILAVNYGLVILCNLLPTLDCIVPLDVALLVFSAVPRDVAPLEPLLLVSVVLSPLKLRPLLLLVVPLLNVMPPLLVLSVGPLLGSVPLLDVVVLMSPEVMVPVL